MGTSADTVQGRAILEITGFHYFAAAAKKARLFIADPVVSRYLDSAEKSAVQVRPWPTAVFLSGTTIINVDEDRGERFARTSTLTYPTIEEACKAFDERISSNRDHLEWRCTRCGLFLLPEQVHTCLPAETLPGCSEAGQESTLSYKQGEDFDGNQ